MSLNFLYLPVRGRVESCLMMLNHRQLPHTLTTFRDWKLWAATKRSKALPFAAQCPILDVTLPSSGHDFPKVANTSHSLTTMIDFDPAVHTKATTVPNSFRLSQSGSITRYVSEITDLTPKNPIKRALVDSCFELTQDLGMINPIVNFQGDTGRGSPENEEKFFKTFSHSICYVNSLYEKDQFLGEDGAVTYADFALYHVLDMVKHSRHKDFVSTHSNLLRMMKDVESLDGISTYLAARDKMEVLGNNTL